MIKQVFILICLISTSVFAQENGSQLKNQNSTQFPANTAEYDSLKAIQIHNDSINKEVAQINSQINSIQIKWDWLMNNPEEKAVADNEGWFDRMTVIKQELIEEKNLLLNQLK